MHFAKQIWSPFAICAGKSCLKHFPKHVLRIWLKLLQGLIGQHCVWPSIRSASRIAVMDGFGSGSGSAPLDAEQMQATLNTMVLQLMQNQIRKTCFGKCFKQDFPAQMAKGDQICLAKCMDRMYEAHAIVVKASMEMAQEQQRQQM